MPWPWIVIVAALWCVVLYLILVVAGLSRRLADLHVDAPSIVHPASALEAIAAGPPIGSPLPEFPNHPELGRASVGEAGRVMLFVSSTCGPCLRLAEQLKRPDVIAARRELTQMDLVVITDENGREQFESFATGGVVVQHAGEVSAALGIRVTPFAIAVDREGVVALGLPGSAADIADLAAKARVADARLNAATA
jgi:hypothetical protein